MDIVETIKESLGTLRVNKLRTGLATLGIVIGIGSVIALISLGQATQKSIQSQIESLGSNLLTVMPGSQNSGAVRGALGGGTTLTLEDAEAIRNSPKISTIKTVSAELTRRTQVTTSASNTNTSIIGATPEYIVVHKLSVEQGRFVSEWDMNGMTKVAVLGPQTARDLFGEGVSPMGQMIRVGGQNLTIIGVTASKGGSGLQNLDDAVYVPLSTAQKQLFGVRYLSTIALEANNPEVMVDAQNEVGYLLLDRHNLNDPTEADFTIFSQQDILDTASSVTGTFTALLSGIAAISLLVGGIGIMNIMLVTVTERTREIGLRKALGAKKKMIITQFLTEAIILTFSGGFIGILIGALISLGLSRLANLPFVLAPYSIALAFVVSAGIGVLFGWYPARRAANLQPIEALRYE